MTEMPSPTVPSATSYRTLRRSRTDRMLGGVCGGLATYLGIDPVAARVAYVLGTLLTGGVLALAYLVFWVVMPEEGVVPEEVVVPEQQAAAPWSDSRAPTT